MPTARELERNISLIMLSGDGSLVYPQATTPNVVHVGPLHIVEPKPLPDVSSVLHIDQSFT